MQNQPTNQQPHLHPELPNDQEEFQSISDKSSDIDQQLKEVQNNLPKTYSFTPVTFPNLDPKTLQLYSMYQQNQSLISNLKSEISRLEHLKKQSVWLQQQPPKNSVQTPISEFFLSCQQTYEKQQQQLVRLKEDIKTIDTEQVRILMARNPNIFNLSQTYFAQYKTLIDAKQYEEGLVLLTQQKKKNKKKKQPTIEDQLSKMSIESEDHPTKTSGIKAKHSEKYKTKYMLRFVNYSELFAELFTKSSLSEKAHYFLPIFSDQTPISFVYSHQLKLILALFKHGKVLAYTLNDHQNQFSEHHSSHKTEQIYTKLKEVAGVQIDFDPRVQVVWWQIRKSKLFVLTSDSLLRIYEILMTQKKPQKFKIQNILYCQSRQKQLGEIVGMCFSKLNSEELLFITKNRNLCKINLTKMKPELLYSYNEDLIQVNPFYLEASDKIFFSNQNFDPIETKLINKKKIMMVQNQKQQVSQNIKILCLETEQKVYVIKVQKHGLLTGTELEMEKMSPQVEIIETMLEE